MPEANALPPIIQGGMGIAVSWWRLARAVASRGQLGVVSGTALERVVAGRLWDGDPDGAVRRAVARFPIPELAARVVGRWLRPPGSPGRRRPPVPLFAPDGPAELHELAVLAGFVEVDLAKEGHCGAVGINLLEKIALPTLPVLYGALLAGVDVVLVGAGIPRELPGHLERLRAHAPSAQRIALPEGGTVTASFDPGRLAPRLPPLARPRFLAIVSSHVLAQSLARAGGVDGFVVEAPVAGGHNAPPRGGACDAQGRPLYGPRDAADLARLRELGLPFWLAGGRATGAALRAARAAGAQGVQVGTAFAFCRESGLEPGLRRRALAAARRGAAAVVTDARASPTGYPFKLVALEASEGARPAEARHRRPCTMGYLREPYRRDDGTVGWRCPAEPLAAWAAKGGDPAATAGRRCLCQGLFAAIGQADVDEAGAEELPVLTAGEDLGQLDRYPADYGVEEVLAGLLEDAAACTA